MFAQSHAAKFFWHGQAKHAQLPQLLNERQRNKLVAQMPAMRVRNNFLIGKAAELIADHHMGFIEACIGFGLAAVQHQLRHARAALGRIGMGAQMHHIRILKSGQAIGKT